MRKVRNKSEERGEQEQEEEEEGGGSTTHRAIGEGRVRATTSALNTDTDGVALVQSEAGHVAAGEGRDRLGNLEHIARNVAWVARGV